MKQSFGDGAWNRLTDGRSIEDDDGGDDDDDDR